MTVPQHENRTIWLFDIDGTLIRSGGAGQHATFDAISAAFGVPVRGEGIGFAGRTDRAIAADVFRLNRIPATEESWQRFRGVYLQCLEQSLEVRVPQVLSGVGELLRRIEKADNNVLGLLTGNMRDGAEAKLAKVALWDRFAFGAFGDHHVARENVAHDAWMEAQRHLNVEVRPEEIWVVGDTVHDIRCARAIGAHVIAVATGGTSYQDLEAERPDRLMHDLTQWTDLEDVIR